MIHFIAYYGFAVHIVSFVVNFKINGVAALLATVAVAQSHTAAHLLPIFSA